MDGFALKTTCSRIFAWTRRLVVWRRTDRRPAPGSAGELLRLARSIEHELPDVAADLRAMALHRPGAAD